MRVISQTTFRFFHFFAPLLYLRAFGQETEIHQINATVKMKMRVKSFDKWAAYQVWKFGEYSDKHFTIQPKDIIVDIGGHIGSFSIWAAKQAFNGKVFTFEPNTENFQLLKENKRINKVSNLQIYNMAVSDKVGKVSFFNSEHQSMGHSMYEDELPNKTTVDATTLLEILKTNKIKKVDFLKIDAEGAEYPILLNANATLLNKIDKIFIEYHDYLNHGKTYQDITNHLKSHGFEVELGANIFQRKMLKLGFLKARRI
jgi:FkbM family methyltransferase